MKRHTTKTPIYEWHPRQFRVAFIQQQQSSWDWTALGTGWNFWLKRVREKAHMHMNGAERVEDQNDNNFEHFWAHWRGNFFPPLEWMVNSFWIHASAIYDNNNFIFRCPLWDTRRRRVQAATTTAVLLLLTNLGHGYMSSGFSRPPHLSIGKRLQEGREARTSLSLPFKCRNFTHPSKGVWPRWVCESVWVWLILAQDGQKKFQPSKACIKLQWEKRGASSSLNH